MHSNVRKNIRQSINKDFHLKYCQGRRSTSCRHCRRKHNFQSRSSEQRNTRRTELGFQERRLPFWSSSSHGKQQTPSTERGSVSLEQRSLCRETNATKTEDQPLPARWAFVCKESCPAEPSGKGIPPRPRHFMKRPHSFSGCSRTF